MVGLYLLRTMLWSMFFFAVGAGAAALLYDNFLKGYHRDHS
jgi:hypothetical protein